VLGELRELGPHGVELCRAAVAAERAESPSTEQATTRDLAIPLLEFTAPLQRLGEAMPRHGLER
jgi:hypothetical protein